MYCESCFPPRNCSIVTCCSFLFFIVIVPLPSRLCPLYLSTTEAEVNTVHKDTGVLCVCVCLPEEVCVCFINEEQLSNQSTLFRLAPLGSNRKYSQDFLSRLQALKQDTSARPVH